MKKLIIYLSIIVVLFAGLYFLNVYADQTKFAKYEEAAQALYQKDPEDLNDLTLKQLDDPHYQQIILPEALEAKIAAKETFFAYFFSPDCPHCIRTTPELMPLADELGVTVHQFNLKEFPDGWDQYGIQGTPTLLFYKDGRLSNGMSGGLSDGSNPGHSLDTFKQFLQQS